MAADVALAARIRAASLLSGRFRLRSGRTSDTYFDKYLFESDPVLLADLVAALRPLVPTHTDVLAAPVELLAGGFDIQIEVSTVVRQNLRVRLHKVEATIERAIRDRKRKMRVAMATGTGPDPGRQQGARERRCARWPSRSDGTRAPLSVARLASTAGSRHQIGGQQ